MTLEMSSIYMSGVALATVTQAVSSVADEGGRHRLVLSSKTVQESQFPFLSEF